MINEIKLLLSNTSRESTELILVVCFLDTLIDNELASGSTITPINMLNHGIAFRNSFTKNIILETNMFELDGLLLFLG